MADRTGCRLLSRSFKVDDFHYIWKGVCDFLLTINSNLIFYRLATIHPQQTDRQTNGGHFIPWARNGRLKIKALLELTKNTWRFTVCLKSLDNYPTESRTYDYFIISPTPNHCPANQQQFQWWNVAITVLLLYVRMKSHRPVIKYTKNSLFAYTVH